MAYRAYKGSGASIPKRGTSSEYRSDQKRFELEAIRQENERRQRELEMAQQYLPQPERTTIDRATDLLSVGQYAVQGLAQDGLSGMWEGIKAGNPFGAGNEQGEYDFRGTLEKYTDWENINPDIQSAGDAMKALGRGEVGKFATALGKGVVEFAGDVLLDPTTYLTGGTSNLVKGTGKKVGKETLEEITQSTVKEMLEKSGREVNQDVISRHTKKLNKARGLATDADDFYFGTKNHHLTIAKAETMQNIGDKTIAPLYNALSASIKDSGLGKLFSTSYGLRQMALKEPEKALNYLEFLDIGKRLKTSKLGKDKEVMQFINETINTFDEGTQREIINFIENPNKYMKYSTYKTVDEDLFNKFTDIVGELADEKSFATDKLTSKQTDLDMLKKMLNGTEDEFIDSIVKSGNEKVQERLLRMVDPIHEYESLEQLVESVGQEGIYDLMMKQENNFDDVVDSLSEFMATGEEVLHEVDYSSVPKAVEEVRRISDDESRAIFESKFRNMPRKTQEEILEELEKDAYKIDLPDVTPSNDFGSTRLTVDDINRKPKELPKTGEQEIETFYSDAEIDSNTGEVITSKQSVEEVTTPKKDAVAKAQEEYDWAYERQHEELYKYKEKLDKAKREAEEAIAPKATYDGMSDEDYINQFGNKDLLREEKKRSIERLKQVMEESKITTEQSKEQLANTLSKEKARIQNAMGYMPKYDMELLQETSDLLKRTPKLIDVIKRQPLSEKTAYINRVLYNGREVVTDSMGEKTANILIDAIKANDWKQIDSILYSATPRGQEVYKSLMAKYGTIFEDAEVGSVEISKDVMDELIANGRNTAENVIEMADRKTGRKGKQIFYSVDDFDKHADVERKALDRLEKRRRGYDLHTNIQNVEEKLSGIRTYLSELRNSGMRIEEYIGEETRLLNELSQQQDILTRMRKSYNKIIESNGGKLGWDGKLEETYKKIQEIFLEKDRFANQRKAQRKAELDYVRELQPYQYEYFKEKHPYTMFDDIPQEELERIANLSKRDISSEFSQDVVDTAKGRVNEDKILSEKLNSIEDGRESNIKDAKEYAGGSHLDYDDGEYQFTDKDGNPVLDYGEKGQKYVGGVKSRVELLKNKTVQKNLNKYLDNLEDIVAKQLPYSPDVAKDLSARTRKSVELIKRWMDFNSAEDASGKLINRRKNLNNFPSYDEIYDSLLDMDVLTIELDLDQIEKLVAPLHMGGRAVDRARMPYVSSNTYDTLRSVVALSMNKPVEVRSMRTGKLLATNGFDVKNADGSVRRAYGKTIKVDQNATNKWVANKGKENIAKRIESEVVEKGVVESVQELVPEAKAIEEIRRTVNAKRTRSIADVRKPKADFESHSSYDLFTPTKPELATLEVEYNPKDYHADFDTFSKKQDLSDVRQGVLEEEWTGSTNQGINDMYNFVQHQVTNFENEIEIFTKRLEEIDKAMASDEVLTTFLNDAITQVEKSGGGVRSGNYIVKEGMPQVEELAEKLSFDNTHFPQDVQDSVVKIMDMFRQMGEDEKRLGKLEKFVKNYVPHVLNPDLLAHPDFQAKLKEADKSMYEKLLKYGGDDAFNPYNMSRTIEGSIADINMRMQKAFKRVGFEFDGEFFLTDLAKIYQARAMKNNELIYTAEYARNLLSMFGSRTDYRQIYDLTKPMYISTSNMRTVLESVPSNKRDELLELLGFDMTKTYNKPFIKVNGKEAKKFGTLFERYAMGEDFLQLFEVPDIVMEQAERMSSTMVESDLQKFVGMYDKFLGLWKANVTYLMPGFHVRNAYSNVFTNWLDVGSKTVDPRFNAQIKAINNGADGVIVAKNGVEYTYQQIRELSDIHNVSGSLFENEFGAKAPANLKEAFKEGNLNPFDLEGFKGYRVGREVGGKIEGHSRMLNFVANLQNGLSVEDAVESTNKFLFDYDDLTTFEKTYMKRIIPFYTWIKKNAGLQLDQLLNNPGKYSMALKAQDKAKQSGDMDREYLPEFMQDWIQLPLTVTNPDGEQEQMMLNPNLPYNGLNDLTPTPQSLFGKLTPAIKIPAELMMNKNVYFNSPIYDKADYLLEQTGTLNQIVDTFDKKGIDKAFHLGNFIGGVKASSVPINQYKQQALESALKKVQKKNKD